MGGHVLLAGEDRVCLVVFVGAAQPEYKAAGRGSFRYLSSVVSL